MITIWKYDPGMQKFLCCLQTCDRNSSDLCKCYIVLHRYDFQPVLESVLKRVTNDFFNQGMIPWESLDSIPGTPHSISSFSPSPSWCITPKPPMDLVSCSSKASKWPMSWKNAAKIISFLIVHILFWTKTFGLVQFRPTGSQSQIQLWCGHDQVSVWYECGQYFLRLSLGLCCHCCLDHVFNLRNRLSNIILNRFHLHCSKAFSVNITVLSAMFFVQCK